jgi:hypothetical protein
VKNRKIVVPKEGIWNWELGIGKPSQSTFFDAAKTQFQNPNY